MKLQSAKKNIDQIELWLSRNKKYLFVLSVFLIIVIDFLPIIYEINTVDNSYISFFLQSLKWNYLALFIVSLYFRKLNTKNLILHSLIALVLYHAIYILNINSSIRFVICAIMQTLYYIRCIFVFIISLVFLKKNVKKWTPEYWLYLALLTLYIPLYYYLLSVLVLNYGTACN